MFRGHSKLTIGTKINIIRGFILKIWGVVTTPSLVVRVTKKPLVRQGLSCFCFDFVSIVNEPYAVSCERHHTHTGSQILITLIENYLVILTTGMAPLCFHNMISNVLDVLDAI